MSSSRKVVIVTGASSGIGAATAALLATQGYDLLIHYFQNHQGAEQTAKHCQAAGAQTLLASADQRDESRIEAMFAQAMQHFGRIDGLVNNAGIVLPQMDVATMTVERINTTLQCNVTGPFICCREAIRYMSPRSGGHGGCIVNVSSAAARLGSPHEYVDYAASKAALDALTKGLALEVADEQIRVNSVRPGFIETEIHAKAGDPNRLQRLADKIPLQRAGTAHEVANAIAWLLSDQASYVTGAFIDCAGGR